MSEIATTYEPIQPRATAEGDFVLETQELAATAGFSRVARAAWFDQTTSIDCEIERLTALKRDSMTVSVGRLQPVEVGGRFALKVDDRCLSLDRYAAGQFGRLLGIGSDYPRRLIASKRPEDAEALVFAIKHACAAGNGRQALVLRVDDHCVVRGVLREGSTYLRNDWYLGVLARAIRGARLSHWRGDGYTIYGNLLIPDTIRPEGDSEYGAMVSLANCEIGKRRFEQLPSLFRAICMNGCIWGETQGKFLRFHRRAAIELWEVEKAIIANVHEQIPIAVQALDKFLATRSFRSDVTMKPLVAQLALDLKLSKRRATAIVQGWWEEQKAVPEGAKTLFGLINGVTRAGQKLDNGTWVKFDRIGGRLVNMQRDQWDGLASRASRLHSAQVDQTFAAWSASAPWN